MTMPRLMSVAFTEEAVRCRAKTVTRRKGWRFLVPGERITLCRKVMGRRPGEPLVRIADVQVISVRREPLEQITEDDLAREGFPGLSREEFMRRYFADAQGIQPGDEVTRIEWAYLDQPTARPPVHRPRWRDVTCGPGNTIPGIDGRAWKPLCVVDITARCGHLAVEILLDTSDHHVLARQRGHVDPDSPAIAPLDPACRTDRRGRSACPGPAQPSLFGIEQLALEA